jgi:hypothetical protein
LSKSHQELNANFATYPKPPSSPDTYSIYLREFVFLLLKFIEEGVYSSSHHILLYGITIFPIEPPFIVYHLLSSQQFIPISVVDANNST